MGFLKKVWGVAQKHGVAFGVGFVAGSTVEHFTGLGGKVIGKVKGFVVGPVSSPDVITQ